MVERPRRDVTNNNILQQETGETSISTVLLKIISGR